MRPSDKYTNLVKATERLVEAITRVQAEPEDDLLRSGLIQTFEFAIELSWKFLKSSLEAENYVVKTPREAIRLAANAGLIDDGRGWLMALDSRNLTSHIYDDKLAKDIAEKIINIYAPLLIKLVQHNQDYS